jgi:hypothetical protein
MKAASSFLLSIIALLFSLVSESSAITIDEFIAAVPSARSESLNEVGISEVSSNRALGGKRQLAVVKTSDDWGDAVLGTGNKVISGVTTPILAFTLGVNAGRGRVTWDADNFPKFLSPNGLGSIDLTDDGASAFETGLVSFDYPSDATLSLRLYDSRSEDGSRYSEVTITLDQRYEAPTAFPLRIPFSLFTTIGSATIAAPGGTTFKTTTVFGSLGGVDITKVGAIELSLAGVAADITITSLRTNGKCTWFPKPDGDIADRCGICYRDADPNYSYEANKAFDGCGLCPQDIGYLFPGGQRDDCSVCLKGPSGYTYESPKDSCGLCPSAPNFGKSKDPCGVCGGDGRSCADCSGTPNGTAQLDRCNVCGGNGTTCLDCLGVPFGTAGIDQCNVCNGDGTACLDCEGTPFGSKVVDACGDCGGLIAALQSCPKPAQCVTVQATAKVKKFERGLARKAQSLRTRFLDEKKRSERVQCGINTVASEALVSGAYAHIVGRSKEIFSQGVEVCGDSCVTVSYAEDVESLLPYFKTIEKEAKFLARRVKKCYSRVGVVRTAGGTNGLAQTIGTVNQGLRGLIAECREQKACPPPRK